MPATLEQTAGTAPPPAPVARPAGFNDWLRSGKRRRALYALLAAALAVAAGLLLYAKGEFDFIVSDARLYYVYLPSLVIDGDLDFRNQIREHWGPDTQPPLDSNLTDRGLVKNKYTIGVPLTLAPSFLIGHAAALTLHALTGAAWCAPDGYSAPYQICNLVFLLGLGAGAMMLIDRLLTRRFRVAPAPAFLAVTTYWLGTNFLYYYVREPFMAHLAGTCWVTASVVLVAGLLSDLDQGRLSGWRLFLFTFTTIMALLCRPSNAFLLPFCVYLLYRVVRTGMAPRMLRLAPAVLLGMWPVAVQFAVSYELNGKLLVNGYEGDEHFHWLEPAAWQTLFSSRHGLFFWSPLLLAAAAGVSIRLWRDRARPDPLVWCFVASFLLLWYCNSCWYAWWFGDAFGARAFLEIGSFFVLGLAGAYEFVGRRGRGVRLAFGGFVGLCLAYHFVLMGCYVLHRIPRGDALLWF